MKGNSIRGAVRARGRTRRTLLGGVALGAAGLWLAACGGDKDESSGASTSGTGATSTSGGSAGGDTPRRGGTLRIHMPVDPPNLDIHRQQAHQTYQTVGLSYNKLFSFAVGPGTEPYGMKLEGDLAGEVTVRPGGSTA